MTDESAVFPGFAAPTENYSKLPHALIDSLPLFSTLGELCVVLYVLRHTWGYSEYDDGRKITMDEFVNGRKRRDGQRIDKGIGLSEPTIRLGIERAIEHGFMRVEVDDHDLARIAKWYSLTMQGERILSPDGGKESLPLTGQESLPRTEKERKQKKERKDTTANAVGNPPNEGRSHQSLMHTAPLVVWKEIRDIYDESRRNPKRVWIERIYEAIGEDEAVIEKWREFLIGWCESPWNIYNTPGQLDAFNRWRASNFSLQAIPWRTRNNVQSVGQRPAANNPDRPATPDAERVARIKARQAQTDALRRETSGM